MKDGIYYERSRFKRKEDMMEYILMLLFILLVLIISAPAINHLFFAGDQKHPIARFLDMLEDTLRHTTKA